MMNLHMNEYMNKKGWTRIKKHPSSIITGMHPPKFNHL